MTFYRTVYQRKFSCPAVVYLKEKSPICDNFVRERSVDSDDGNTTVESVVGTLDKLNGLNSTINKQKQKQQINRYRVPQF